MSTPSIENILRTIRSIIHDIPTAATFNPVFDLAYNLQEHHEISFVERFTGGKSPVRLFMGNDRNVSINVTIYEIKPIGDGNRALSSLEFWRGAVYSPLSSNFAAALKTAFIQYPGLVPIREPGLAVNPITRITYPIIKKSALNVDPDASFKINENMIQKGSDEIVVRGGDGEPLVTVFVNPDAVEVFAGYSGGLKKVGSAYRHSNFDGLSQMVDSIVRNQTLAFAP